MMAKFKNCVIVFICILPLSDLLAETKGTKKKEDKSVIAMQDKAKNCVGCHGENGISNNPVWPNLAGQKKAYLVKQLKDFKVGVRKDSQMTFWVKDLTDKDIDALAEYYSAMKIVEKK